MPAPPTSATRRLRRLGRQLRVHHPPAGAGPAAAALAEDDAATLATELGLRCNTLSPWGFGVQIEGFDTSRPAAPASAALLRSLLAKHKLLLIRGGRLDAPQLADLGRSLELGEAETFGAADYVDVDYMSTFPDEPNVMQIEYGPHSAPADINIWHMDHSWHVAPTRYELSYADVSPATGGDVIFADTCAAYETLSPLMQDMLSGATCLNILANGYQYDTNRSQPPTALPFPPSPHHASMRFDTYIPVHNRSTATAHSSRRSFFSDPLFFLPCFFLLSL